MTYSSAVSFLPFIFSPLLHSSFPLYLSYRSFAYIGILFFFSLVPSLSLAVIRFHFLLFFTSPPLSRQSFSSLAFPSFSLVPPISRSFAVLPSLLRFCVHRFHYIIFHSFLLLFSVSVSFRFFFSSIPLSYLPLISYHAFLFFAFFPFLSLPPPSVSFSSPPFFFNLLLRLNPDLMMSLTTL